MKRTLAILLALLMVVSLVACAKAPTTTPTTPADTNTPAEAPADEPAEAPADEPVEEPVTVESALPIAEETVNFRVWTSNGMTGLPITNNSENTAWQEMEKRTNIHIEWEHGSGWASAEQFNLSIASGDWADSYWGGSWAGSMDYYLEEEMILDVTDLIAQYAPNYDALRRIDATTYRTSLTDASRSAGFYEVSQSKQWSFLGPCIRQDFLDKVNMALPETYDELHDVLVAFRDQLNIEMPLAIASTDDWLTVGFGTVYSNSYFNGLFYQVDGEVKFGPITDEFRSAVQLLADWYAEGLIDREFYARTDAASTMTDYMCNDQVGAGRAMYSTYDMYKMTSSNPDFKVVPLYPPVQNKGDQINFVFGGGNISYIKGVPNVIMTSCEAPETMVKWFDYMYSEEGSLLLNYGIEGEDFYFNEDGRPAVTEKIYNDPNLSSNQMLAMHTGSGSGGPWWYDWTREVTVPGINPDQLASEQIWTGNQAPSDELYSFATLTVNQDDATDYNTIMADVQTTIAEQLARFITGELSMDADWDAFVAQMYSQGIEDAIAMQQAAYDSFAQRGE